ncbi:MAG: nucleotidyl transferase AbiEii/AbiGii toxin family protein [Candidatus Marinimicrobia bacterium]|nr:nucleotidyl transferase AbiEii/AbiGii toxin family protein [Candidatus Neomarinimicrobiota bacterium]MBL7010980.1 nucleotidyl transferase AbiEii/AbiGii toxin family protein [Candidatus Neomarinimicrobiota bacterium]MBL7031120.1 nucleotidyl transferase AbiEii/AbiGii toxin family protein [Candidatus Neomarinimicrobiota bacterium]
MKDQAVAIAKSKTDIREAKNELREYLQHVILRKMFELNMNRELVFHGGTALRIIHGLDRFSEDLDFHTLKPENAFDLELSIQKIARELKLNGYSPIIKVKINKKVQSAFIKFSNLLFEATLSPLPEENISIKLEIDTNSPMGFMYDKSMVNTYFPFSVIHHDKESFLSGKCNAVLQRRYTKGRDYFDLLFYLSRWKDIQPNFTYLNNCLEQSGYTGIPFSSDNWKLLMLEKLKNIDWQLVQQDVQPFLSQLSKVDLLTFDNFKSLLNNT